MRHIGFLLCVIAGLMIFSGVEIVSRCCPPPPITTKPGRTIPTFPRTAIPTTFITGLPGTLPGGLTFPEAEFMWEDWKTLNFGDLLVEYPSLEDAQYITPLTIEDLPRLLTLLDYRGLYDKGIHKIALDNIKLLGKPAMELLIDFVLGKKQLNTSKCAKYLNKFQFRELAVRALSELTEDEQTAGVVAALLSEPYRNENTASAAEAVSALIKDNERRIRFWASMSLANMKPSNYLSTFVKLLEEDKEKYVKCAGALGISAIHEQKAINALRSAKIGRSHYHARTFAVAALGLIGSADPVEELQNALVSQNGNVRTAAVLAIGYLIHKRANTHKDYSELIDILRGAFLSEFDGAVRRSFALSLFVIDNYEVLEELKRTMKEFRDPVIHSLYALAHAKTGIIKDIESIYRLPAGKGELFARALGYTDALLLGTSRDKIISDMLRDDSPVIRAAAIMMLDKFNLSAARAILREFRLDADPMLNRAVAFSASVYFGKTDFDFSKKILNGRDEAAKAVAYIGIGFLNNSDALSYLTSDKPSDSELRKCHSLAMSLMGGFPLFTDLCDFLKDEKEQVRAAACTALAMLDQPASLDKILDIVKNDKGYKARAYAMASLPLLTIPKERQQEVVEVLGNASKNDKHYMPRAYAVMMLSLFSDNRIAFNYARDALEDKHSDVKATAALAMGMFKSFSAARELRNITQKYAGTPFGQAAYYGLGIIGSKSNASLLVADFAASLLEDDLEAIAFAVGQSAAADSYLGMSEFFKDYDTVVRSRAVKCLGMMRDLPEESRRDAIKLLEEYKKYHEKRSKTFQEEMNVQFYSAVIRYTFGKRSAIKDVLDTVNHPNFLAENQVNMDWDSLMEPVNDRFPKWYKMKPFYWTDYE